VAKTLGFDPENPMVKMEASRILSRYSGLAASAIGYQEIDLDTNPTGTAPTTPGASPNTPGSTDVTAESPEIDLARRPPSSASASAPVSRTAPVSDEEQSEPLLRRSLAVAGGLVAGLIIISLLILLRASKKNRF
jgi:hypothetical protein